MAHDAHSNSDRNLMDRHSAWWQVLMLDEAATQERGGAVYKVLAELEHDQAEYECGELRKAGHIARKVQV